MNISCLSILALEGAFLKVITTGSWTFCLTDDLSIFFGAWGQNQLLQRLRVFRFEPSRPKGPVMILMTNEPDW
jgi:hypothetical protein